MLNHTVLGISFWSDRFRGLIWIMLQIIPLPRNHVPYTTRGIFHIPCISWNQVDVHMPHRLPGGGTTVDATVEAIGMKALGEKGFDAVGD